MKLAVPLFPSTEWFEAVMDVFNSDELKTTAGGGTCDAIVGIISGESLFQLKFEGIECVSVDVLEDEDQLGMTDFYIELHPEDWKDMLNNIKENGAATLEYTLNTIDLETPEGITRSWAEDQYRQDLFFRYNQTFQYFFDASSKVMTSFTEE